jgi:hypothetical protein
MGLPLRLNSYYGPIGEASVEIIQQNDDQGL